MKTDISIQDFQREYATAFERLNKVWIEQYFWMEPMDFQILQNPEEEIINKGGKIFFALLNDLVVGTVALRLAGEHSFELTKMAVDGDFQGQQIGRRLLERAVHEAKTLKATELFLYSNTKLETAINLYKRFGFVEVPLDGPYKRSDIKMQLIL